MKLTIDYLTVIDKSTHKAFYDLCDTGDEFKRLLAKNNDFQVDGEKLTYQSDLDVSINVRVGQVEGKEQRFFRTTIKFDGPESDLDGLSRLLKALRQTIADAGGQVQTLSSDLSAFYAERCYPLIHRTENLMRKLLKVFMVTQVGKDWLDETSPKSVEAAIETARRRGGQRSEFGDAVYDLDFIHLGDFLFKSYSRRPLSELIEIIDAADTLTDLDLDQLKIFKERSNWERYFSQKVDCTDEYLNKRWVRLYELRNKVAHNAVIGKSEFDEIARLSLEVGEKLEEALEKVDEINIPEQEKELLAEELVSNVNELSGEFINEWRNFESVLRNFAGQEAFESTDGPSNRLMLYRSPQAILRELWDAGDIDEEMLKRAKDVSSFRNAFVHSGTFEADEGTLAHYLSVLRTLAKYFEGKMEVPDSGKPSNRDRLLPEGAELIDSRIKLYRLPDSRIVKIQYSRFHANHQTFWYGIAPNSYANAKKRGCSAVVFVMGDVGLVIVPIETLDRFLETTYVTNNPDGSLRHHHVFVTPPPNVRLKGPLAENDIDIKEYFVSSP